jgi:hypothetical protein
MFAEAHRTYGGMGTILVIKVGWMQKMIAKENFSEFDIPAVGLSSVCLQDFCAPLLFSTCRSLLSQPASLANW